MDVRLDSYDWIMLAIFNLRLQCLRNHKVSSAHAKAKKDYRKTDLFLTWNRGCRIPYFSPYTIGFLKPFIVAPESLADSRLSEMILRHEYSHLCCHDSAVKLLCLLAICLHFYNPLTLLTLLLYTSFSENIADQAATEGFTTEEKKAYAVALVNLSARNRQVPVVWKNNLLGAKHTMKRRVEFIMMKNRKASKIGTAAAILASVFLSGTTVFGYAPMQTVEVTDSSPITKEFVSFNDSNQSAYFNDSLHFKTENDEVIPVSESDLDGRALICTHDFKSGYADRHYSQSNGGCIVKTYTAKICQKCNHLVIMDLIGTTNYPKCPHK
ncbi:MAG: M56 family metallopeptidase [Blautia faecis]